MAWHNRTKIVATLGPASNSDAMVTKLVLAGVDVFRINCAHMDHAGIASTVERVRRLAKKHNRAIGILADLQGPKIRVGKLKNAEPIYLKRGNEVVIDVTPGVVGEAQPDGTVVIGSGYRGLATDVRPGERILLDDGNLELRTLSVKGSRIRTRVVYGGMLHQFKGINLPGSKVSADCLSAKDLSDLASVIANEVDFVALSFVRHADDVLALRKHIDKTGSDVQIIAKIERPEAVKDIVSILAVADGLMVARGDMGVEMGAEAVPPVQKRIIELANQARKPVITATQMLESMVLNPRPTRAEASDVANAIYDGTSAVMLSAETASGKHPVRSVRIMEKIIRTAERDVYAAISERRRRMGAAASSVTLATVRAAAYAAYEANARLIAVYTETGTTARMLAGERPPTHILAFTPSVRAMQKLALIWGIIAKKIPPGRTSHELTLNGDRIMRQEGRIKTGDRIVQIAGTIRQSGLTNTMSIRQM
ncbi:MAG: pyruvate kinase [Planctomycetes bacterium]|jgi:pyruvate kinase|nr:pyruvate kinase [Planctomycetota bacterium]